MRHRLFRFLVLVTLGLGVSQGLGPGATTAQTPETAKVPRASAVITSHDFGTVERGTPLVHVFNISNDGTAPLTISRIEMSQPGMKSRFAGVIAPGATGRITIEWDASRFTGDIQADATVFTNDPMRPRLGLTLLAAVRRAIAIEPAPDVFFSVFRDETLERRLAIVNNEPQPLEIKGLRPDGTHFTATIAPIKPGFAYEVTVKVPAGLPAGRYMEAVFVETNRPGIEPRIGVNVFVKENLYASPEVIDLGEVNIKQISATPTAPYFRHRTTLRKREGTFAITSITSDLPALRLEASPAGPSEAFEVDVRFDPSQLRAGRLDGVIRVATDDKAFPLITIPVRGAAK
jgi:Protein of unknown function (DUF1573)